METHRRDSQGDPLQHRRPDLTMTAVLRQASKQWTPAQTTPWTYHIAPLGTPAGTPAGELLLQLALGPLRPCQPSRALSTDSISFGTLHCRNRECLC
eukprot:4439021-Amphidinium_carterae.2